VQTKKKTPAKGAGKDKKINAESKRESYADYRRWPEGFGEEENGSLWRAHRKMEGTRDSGQKEVFQWLNLDREENFKKKKRRLLSHQKGKQSLGLHPTDRMGRGSKSPRIITLEKRTAQPGGSPYKKKKEQRLLREKKLERS